MKRIEYRFLESNPNKAIAFYYDVNPNEFFWHNEDDSIEESGLSRLNFEHNVNVGTMLKKEIEFKRGSKIRIVGLLVKYPVIQTTSIIVEIIKNKFGYYTEFDSNYGEAIITAGNPNKSYVSSYIFPEYITLVPEEIPLVPTCNHKWINVGFTSITMCCKYCDIQKP